MVDLVHGSSQDRSSAHPSGYRCMPKCQYLSKNKSWGQAGNYAYGKRIDGFRKSFALNILRLQTRMMLGLEVNLIVICPCEINNFITSRRKCFLHCKIDSIATRSDSFPLLKTRLCFLRFLAYTRHYRSTYGARMEHVRSTYGARTEHVGKTQ